MPSKACRLASAGNRQKIRGPKKSERNVEGESLPRRRLRQERPGQIKNKENNSWSTIVAGEKDYHNHLCHVKPEPVLQQWQGHWEIPKEGECLTSMTN